MKPAPFAYVRPTSLSEAVRALADDPGAKVLAGGQSLVPLLSMRLAGPSTLVDLNGLPGLDAVEVDDAEVRVGALARHSDVLASEAVRRAQPLVAQALSHVAHPTIRNRGTTVGSIVHADAAGEMPMVLLLLDGSLDVVGPGGARTIAARDLFVGLLETSLAHDEIAVAARLPVLPEGGRTAFAEIARRHGDYALVGVGAVAVAGSVRLGFVSVGDVPSVVEVGGLGVEEAVEHALAHLDPGADIHATVAYRTHLVRVLVRRVLGELAQVSEVGGRVAG